jgi:hypothetical protein
MYFKSLTSIPPICFGLMTIFHAIGLMYLSVVLSLCPCQRNFLRILSISLITQVGSIKVNINKIGIAESVEFISVTLPPEDNNGVFQPDNLFLTLCMSGR